MQSRIQRLLTKVGNLRVKMVLFYKEFLINDIREKIKRARCAFVV